MTKIRLLFPAVTMVVITILSLLLFRQCDKTKVAEDRAFSAETGLRKAKEVDQVQSARISTLNDSLAKIQTLRSKDSTDHLRSIQALETRNKQLSRKYSQAKAEIKPISDSIPSVKAFEQASDSLLSVRDSIILAEQRNLLVVHKSYQGEIAQLHGKIDAERLKTDAWRTAAEDAQRDLGPETRWKKFWRGTAIVLAGATAVLIVSGQ